MNLLCTIFIFIFTLFVPLMTELNFEVRLLIFPIISFISANLMVGLLVDFYHHKLCREKETEIKRKINKADKGTCYAWWHAMDE